MNHPADMHPRRRPIALSIGAGCLLSAMAMQANAASVYNQSFESDTAGWRDNAELTGYGFINRVASGTNGIASPDGGYHAEITSIGTKGPVTNFGAYSSEWPGDFVSEISVYIDRSQMGSNGGFDYSLAINGQDGNHRRDFAFHFTNDSDTNSLLLNVDYGSALTLNTELETLPGTVTLSAVGWYTLRSTFIDNAGILAVQMDVLDPSDDIVFSTVMSNPTDDIATIVGGNRYGWFAALDMDQPLAIDNISLNVSPIPEPAAAGLAFAGVALMGLRRRRSI